MSEPPADYDPETCTRFLRDLGASGEQVLPIAEAALALASFEHPRVGPSRYREHLRVLSRDVGRHAGTGGDAAARACALNEIILLKYGYSGDELTYDDLQNANLMRVVDRRKGLPVALGILYMHAGRAQGCGAAELRELLKATTGQESELQAEYYAPVPDRDVLLRLQNNLKARLLQAERHERGVGVVETMLMLAPDLAELWREAGMLHARLGNMRAAAAALEQFVLRAPDGMARHQAAAMLRQLKAKLN